MGKYLLTPCWIKFGTARWFRKTPVAHGAGPVIPKRQRYAASVRTSTPRGLFVLHRKVIRILRNYSFALQKLLSPPRPSHSAARTYHCRVWEKQGWTVCLLHGTMRKKPWSNNISLPGRMCQRKGRGLSTPDYAPLSQPCANGIV